MQLHQLLRFVTYGTCIVIFDIQGIMILDALDKSAIPVDLYEYEIAEISTGVDMNRKNKTALYIELRK